MSTRFALFLSALFHPLLMPTLLFSLLLFLVPSALNLDMFADSVRLSLLVLIFVGTFMVPAVLTYYLLRLGYVQDMQLTHLSDRRLPYFMTALIYLLVAYLFSFRMQAISSLAPEIGILIGSIAVSILLGGIISLSWQISAHGIGIGGVMGTIAGLITRFDIPDLFLPLVGLILLTGLVASARLKLNAHTPAQISAGLILGLLVSLFTVYRFFA